MNATASPGDQHPYAPYWRKRQRENQEMYEKTQNRAFLVLARNCGLTAETGLGYERICEIYGYPHEAR